MRVLRLGLMDTVLADRAVSVVLCFGRPLDEDRFAAGPALALDRVPGFAGRLRADGDAPRAVCDDSGVPLDIHTADGALAEATGRIARLSPLVAPHSKPGTTSLAGK
ncbi:hypothetical protein ACFV1W_33980 [Kitasatospora sp. NPDC059648]|uniref:hypothetical protein n=1 Tax=Kitasatospora sp. NPDC059648 TaxID=3346894 RepID=UPI003678C833